MKCGRPCAALRLAVALIVTTIALGGGVASAEENPVGEPEAVPGELLVGFADGVSLQAQRFAVSRAGGTLEESIDSIDSALITPSGRRSTDQIAARLARNDDVEFIEPNYVLHGSRVPNDPSFPSLWGLRNTGQAGGVPDADVNAQPAWDVTTGGDVVVAVVDTGVDYTHPDLNDNMWVNPGEAFNGADDDRNGIVDDVYGANFAADTGDPRDDSSHGTHVAGIIAAEGNNALGVTGVNWKARLMALKFLDENGAGNTADAAAAIDYAVRGGARVVNASWGGPGFSYTLNRAIRNASGAGAVVVAAAGNESENSDSSPEYPAAFDLPNVISVAATDSADGLEDFSNYGVRTVDLAAPGDEILSTVPKAADASGYSAYSGTSMATPYVTGAAALYLSRSPASTVQQVRDVILQSVDPIPGLAGKVATGGRLNVGRMFGVGRVVPTPAPSGQATSDRTAPSPFRLISPRNRYSTHRRGVRFRWQRSRDTSGIRAYRLYIDGKLRRTVRDKDGPGGRTASAKTRVKIHGGRHRWYVRAYDYAGNTRKSKRARRGSRATRVLFIRKPQKR